MSSNIRINGNIFFRSFYLMPDGSLPMIIGMLICLAFSAFLAASETAFTSLNRNKLKNLSIEGNKRATRVIKMCENYDKLLSTILVGNNIVNILLSSLATVWFIALLANTTIASAASTISTVVVTIVVLIFGEITPKSLAKDHPEGVAMGVSRFLSLLIVILTPINFFFMLWKKLVSKIFKPSAEDTVTEGEVLTLIDEAHEDGNIDEYNKEIIENVFEFDDLTAGEIATHRTELTMLASDAFDEEWEDAINNSRFSRYPVYGESVDDIIGILDARTYFRLEDKSRENVLKEAVEPAYLVPETVKADILFRNMKKQKQSLAVVLDEYGGVLGIVTLTDLIECLIGEFATEAEEGEEVEELITALENSTWQINGTAPISDVEEALGINITDEDSDTFGGYVLGLYGSVPEDGTTFALDTEDLNISIEAIKDHKIEKAIVSIKAHDAESDETQDKE
ncbi:MAG: HlyC/CorC family transporter [Ruminococcaceae bacterium]|nr:HlyC/CorC family transporter [Oscillospiraceae bacterium]